MSWLKNKYKYKYKIFISQDRPLVRHGGIIGWCREIVTFLPPKYMSISDILSFI